MAQDALKSSKMSFQKNAEAEVTQEKSYEQRFKDLEKKDGTINERAEGGCMIFC